MTPKVNRDNISLISNKHDTFLEMKGPLDKSIQKLAKLNRPVLVEGESGSGKTGVCKKLHHHSGRSGRCIQVGCGNLDHDTIDSLLFGHTKGAFTDAREAKEGLLKAADNGTLILNDIDQLSLRYQKKLFAFLDTGEFFPLGETKEMVQSDVRIIANSNKCLKSWAENGQFHRDLYYRLSYLNLRIPPLRKRKDEISAYAQLFVKIMAMEMGIETPLFEDGIFDLFSQMKWEGNLRELEKVIANLMLHCIDETGKSISIGRAVQELIDETYGPYPRGLPFEDKEKALKVLDKYPNLKFKADCLGVTRTTVHNYRKKRVTN